MQLLAFSTFIISALAMPLSSRGLPSCDATPRACACPSGTTFTNSTSWAKYPAAVEDVVSITGNFFETAWFGTSPIKTSGQANTVGAKRTLMGEFPKAGTYPATEKLTMHKELPSNSGLQIKYQMTDTPFYYNQTSDGQGEVAGYWEHMDIHAIGSNQTYFLWNIYSCFSAPFNFKGFHESAMNNITSILKSDGKMHGDMNGPHTY